MSETGCIPGPLDFSEHEGQAQVGTSEPPPDSMPHSGSQRLQNSNLDQNLEASPWAQVPPNCRSLLGSTVVQALEGDTHSRQQASGDQDSTARDTGGLALWPRMESASSQESEGTCPQRGVPNSKPQTYRGSFCGNGH